MSPRIKKLLGILILLPAMFIYFVGVITLADLIPAHKVLQIVYFAVAGIIWVFPLKPLFLWMNSPPRDSRD